MRFGRSRFVPQLDVLSRRILPYVGAAAVAIPAIAPDATQDTSNDSSDSSDASDASDSTASSAIAVDYSVNSGINPTSDSSDSGNGPDSTDGTAVDALLGDLAGPDDGDDDTEYDPNSTGSLDDSDYTSAVPVSGVSAY
jgi:hypothetical protein